MIMKLIWLLPLAAILLLSLNITSDAFATNDDSQVELDVDVVPESLLSIVSWDLGDNPEREYCFSKTEAYYLPLEFGTNFKLTHFFGTDTNSYNGNVHFFQPSDIPEEAKIECEGEIEFLKSVVVSTYDSKYYDYSMFYSFGEVSDGKVVYLDEAIVRVTNVGHYDIDCSLDVFNHTSELLVNSTHALYVIYDTSSGLCDIDITDITDDSTYDEWFNR